jgi:hypothetical protein
MAARLRVVWMEVLMSTKQAVDHMVLRQVHTWLLTLQLDA